jgi:4-diphosphocytidyl-2-C-methyl-D-erythritol kinase
VRGAAFAPAKVNLYLHVAPPGAAGMHPLSSLMVFADVGDRIRLEPAPALELAVTGPYGGAVGEVSDNLVLRAARALAEAVGGAPPAGRLVLDKQLPVAAGLGGGSSDAGAVLRLLGSVLKADESMLEQVAARLGSDGPACLRGAPVIAEGLGERLSPAPRLPVLHAVLANPGVGSSTPAVYRAYDAAGAKGRADRPELPEAFDDVHAVAEAMTRWRNDLEAPAIALNPAIGEALALLRAQPESLLARVSGSGATCFCLCADADEAAAAASRLASLRPTWWVRDCRLGGPWPDTAW